MNVENELKSALNRKQPDAGFASRVMAAIDRDETHRRRPVWWRAIAASLTLAALLGGWAAHEVIERRRGEEAREQVLRAMNIASSKVHYAQQQVHEIGSR
jgi:hypothetical protein